jgi:Tol biopolymer transport system component
VTLIGFILFAQFLPTSAQDHAAQRIEEVEICDHGWVEEIVPLALDKNLIKKYSVYPSLSYIGSITLSPTGDHIAFSLNSSSIWVVSRDGSGLLCLTIGLKGAHSPYWSKDGKSIKFIKGGDENNYGIGTIMQVAPDGTQRKIIGDCDLREPQKNLFPPWYYSPNGMYVLRPSGKPLDNNVYVARVKDQKVVAIYKSRGSTLGELWFPDGKEILIEKFLGHGESELIVFSLTGKRKVILPRGRMNLKLAIHPSGQLVAYFDDYINELHFLAKDGSKDHRILKGDPQNFYIAAMTWSSKGDILVFSSGNQIYFLKLKKQVP